MFIIPMPPTSNEIEAMRSYLKGGGAVLILLDPPYQTGLEGLLGEWGVEVGNDFVIDTSLGLEAARARVEEIVGMVLAPGWTPPRQRP